MRTVSIRWALVMGGLTAACLGAKSKRVHAPLPPEAYTAKSIAIVNHARSQSYTDRAFEELQKWGRYSVITDSSKADIVLVIDSNVHSVGGIAHTYGNNTYVSDNEVLDVTVGFFLSGKEEPFFSETERAAFFRKSATKRCIDDLQKRLAADTR